MIYPQLDVDARSTDTKNEILAAANGKQNGSLATFAVGYHEVSASSSSYYYSSSLSQFQGHLEILADRRWLSRKPPIVSLLTFDDGYASNYWQAFPMLEQFGVKATFFVLADYVGSSPKLLTWSQARELVSAGHSVQSHGRSHRFLTQCNAKDLKNELAGSKAKIEDALGAEVTGLSVPGGRWNRQVLGAAREAGYLHFYHSNPWQPPRSASGMTIQGRLMVTNRMRPKDLERQMRAGSLRNMALRAAYAIKHELRRLVGDRTYHQLWCWLANFKDDSGTRIQLLPDERYREEDRRA